MKTKQNLLRAAPTGAVVLLLVSGVLLSLSAVPRKVLSKPSVQRVPEKTIRVRSFANGLKVVDFHVEEGKGALRQGRLVLRNDYFKNITAFVVTPGEYRKTSDFLPDVGIPPGGTHEARFTLPPVAGDLVIDVNAVVFDDRTGDGDARLVKEIEDHRRGMKWQIERILPLLQSVADSSDQAVPSALRLARNAVAALSVRTGEQDPYKFFAGLHNAKEGALMDLDQLEQLRNKHGYAVFKARLSELINDYAKKVGRF